MANCFIIADPIKCLGCRTCEVACVVAHSKQDIFTSKPSEIEFFPRLNVIKTAEVSAPIQCRQCEDAPCAKVCPVKAITIASDHVHIDEKKCVGCKTCVVACPVGAMDMVTEFKNGKKVTQARIKVNAEDNKERIIAHKCDICSGRPGGPACVEVCLTKALRMVSAEEMDNMIKAKRRKNVNAMLNISNAK